MNKKEVELYIEKHQKNKERSSSFVDYLYLMMDKYGFDKPSDLYNKANISRQLWSSLISEKSHPSLEICIKLVFALRLNNRECKLFLKKAGFTLSSASNYSLIIRYALEHNVYDLNELNKILEEFGYENSLIY